MLLQQKEKLLGTSRHVKNHAYETVAEPTRLICVFNPAFSGQETGFAQ
jgi:hypothetical protein